MITEMLVILTVISFIFVIMCILADLDHGAYVRVEKFVSFITGTNPGQGPDDE